MSEQKEDLIVTEFSKLEKKWNAYDHEEKIRTVASGWSLTTVRLTNGNVYGPDSEIEKIVSMVFELDVDVFGDLIVRCVQMANEVREHQVKRSNAVRTIVRAVSHRKFFAFCALHDSFALHLDEALADFAFSCGTKQFGEFLIANGYRPNQRSLFGPIVSKNCDSVKLILDQGVVPKNRDLRIISRELKPNKIKPEVVKIEQLIREALESRSKEEIEENAREDEQEEKERKDWYAKNYPNINPLYPPEGGVVNPIKILNKN